MKLDKLKEIAAASERGETSYLEMTAGNDSYCRKFVPRERLIILGGGHISQPVCRIASMLDFAIHGDTPKAIMTVIGTKGSIPAPSGAMMVIDTLGVSEGTIGGGCSEAEVIGLARRIAAEGGREIAYIDMTNEAAAQEGMACGGTMEVLVEAIEK